MEVKEILSELEVNRGRFPRKALEQAIENREAIIPELLRILQESKQNIQQVAEQDGYMAHLYAMYLLAQFREKRAYPLVVDLFSIPGEIALDVTGDVVTEDLRRILASVCRADTSLIERLAENSWANEYVRGAALRALLILVVEGEKSREEVLRYYQGLFQGWIERRPGHFWDALVSCCCDLYPQEVVDQIEDAYADDLVDEQYIDFDWVTRCLAHGQETALATLKGNPRNRFIKDVFHDLEWWACFNQHEKRKTPNHTSKVGRNDPCPCGSGKKYKKCCGPKELGADS